MTTARTSVTKVKERLGSANIDHDIDDTTIERYITHASAYIERYTQRQSFSSMDSDLVEVACTDLTTAYVLRHMAAGKYYAGADYRIGAWTTVKSTGGQQLLALADQYERLAHASLKVLGNASYFRFEAT